MDRFGCIVNVKKAGKWCFFINAHNQKRGARSAITTPIWKVIQILMKYLGYALEKHQELRRNKYPSA